MNCIDCEIIFFVEDDGQWDKPDEGETYVFDCPNCNRESKYIDSITIIEEDENV